MTLIFHIQAKLNIGFKIGHRPSHRLVLIVIVQNRGTNYQLKRYWGILTLIFHIQAKRNIGRKIGHRPSHRLVLIVKVQNHGIDCQLNRY